VSKTGEERRGGNGGRAVKRAALIWGFPEGLSVIQKGKSHASRRCSQRKGRGDADIQTKVGAV